MIGGNGTPRREVYCDTYRNFMLLAVYLGWQCDQDVFPARMRASQPEGAVCSTLERMEQLAGLAQPSEYSIKFSISNGAYSDVAVTWRAYVFDLSDMAYKGRIIYESKSNEACYIEALTYKEFILLTKCAYNQCVGSGVIKTLAEKETFELLGSSQNPNFSRIFHTYGNCYALRRSELRDEPWLRTWAGIFMGNPDHAAILQLSGNNSLTGNVDLDDLEEKAKSVQEKISRRETAVGAIASMGRIAWSFVPGASAIAEVVASSGQITSLTASGIAYVKDKLSETLPVYQEVVEAVATEAGVEEKVEGRAEEGKERIARKLMDRVIYGRKSADKGDNVRLEFVPFPITMETMGHSTLEDIGKDIEAHLGKEKKEKKERGWRLTSKPAVPPALSLFLRRSCYGRRKTDIAASQPLSGIVSALDAGSGNSMLGTVTAVQAGLDSIEQSNVSDLERRQAQLADEIARAKTNLANLYEVGKQSELLSNLSDLIASIQALMPLYRRPAVALESMSRAYAKRELDGQTESQIDKLVREGSTQEIIDLFADTDKTLDTQARKHISKVFEKAFRAAQCGPGGATETEISLLLTEIKESLRDLQLRGRDGSVVEDALSGAKPGDTVLSSPNSSLPEPAQKKDPEQHQKQTPQERLEVLLKEQERRRQLPPEELLKERERRTQERQRKSQGGQVGRGERRV